MFLLTIGSALMYMFATDAFEVAEKQPASVYYSHPMDTRVGSGFSLMEPIEVPQPLTEKLFKNIVHQAYDYSCGSAALTNLLNGYVGRQFTEKQVMDGLLKFGEYDKIVQRRGFSLLDMKRLVTALGHQSNGFKGTLEELKKSVDSLSTQKLGDWITEQQAQKILGLKATSLWALRKKRKIKFSKIGSKIFYSLKSMEEYIEKNAGRG